MEEGRSPVAATATMVGLRRRGQRVALLQVAVGGHHMVLQTANGRFQHRLLIITVVVEAVMGQLAHQPQLLQAAQALTLTPIPLHLPVATTAEATHMPTPPTRTKVVLALEHPLAGVKALRLIVRREVALLRLVHVRVTTEAATAARAAVMDAAATRTITDPWAMPVARLPRSLDATPVDTHHLGPQQHSLG